MSWQISGVALFPHVGSFFPIVNLLLHDPFFQEVLPRPYACGWLWFPKHSPVHSDPADQNPSYEPKTPAAGDFLYKKHLLIYFIWSELWQFPPKMPSFFCLKEENLKWQTNRPLCSFEPFLPMCYSGICTILRHKAWGNDSALRWERKVAIGKFPWRRAQFFGAAQSSFF